MSYPDRRRRDDPDRKFLQSRVWREKLRPAQLAREPICRFCQAVGAVTVAEHVDHIRRPRGDTRLQRDRENLQSLCPDHHAQKSGWERGDTSQPLAVGYAPDGWILVWTPAGGITRR